MLTHKQKRFKLKVKYEVIEMSKRLALVAVFTGIMLSAAPLTGLAEPTELSIQVEEEIKKQPGVFSKSWVAIKGGYSQARIVVENSAKLDERMKAKDEEIRLYRLEIKKLKRQQSEVRVVSSLRLDDAKTCITTIQAFFDTQVEGK